MNAIIVNDLLKAIETHDGNTPIGIQSSQGCDEVFLLESVEWEDRPAVDGEGPMLVLRCTERPNLTLLTVAAAVLKDLSVHVQTGRFQPTPQTMAIIRHFGEVAAITARAHGTTLKDLQGSGGPALTASPMLKLLQDVFGNNPELYENWPEARELLKVQS